MVPAAPWPSLYVPEKELPEHVELASVEVVVVVACAAVVVVVDEVVVVVVDVSMAWRLSV